MTGAAAAVRRHPRARP